MEYKKLQDMVIKGYSGSTANEWKRLQKRSGIVEYLTTVHYLERYLPDKGVVADIGSGPGRYALWLSQHSYDVVAVDPVQANIRSLVARFRAKGLIPRLKACHVGFAQELSMLESNSFDAVICLGGPMSHIMDEAQRRKAAKELLRIAKPGARLFVSAMGRLSLFNGTTSLFQRDLDSKYIDSWYKTGDYFGGWGFLPFHGFRPNELQGLFGSRINLLAKTALEGFVSYNGDYIPKLVKNRRRWKKWLRIHFSISEEPETIGISEHYMIIAEKRPHNH